MQTPDSHSHTIDITLDPPLASAHEASLWVEESEGGRETTTTGNVNGNGDGDDAMQGHPPSRPTLVLSRVDGAGGEQRFPLPAGAGAEGIRAKLRKSGRMLRVTVPIREVGAAVSKNNLPPADTLAQRRQSGSEVAAAITAAASGTCSGSGSDSAGLYKFNPVYPQLWKAPGFNP
jgi:hypothetical protein